MPIVDYSQKLPDEIMEAIEETKYTIKKDASLSWDGRHYIVRIPSEIASEYGITSPLYKTEKRIINVLYYVNRPLTTSDITKRSELSWQTTRKYLERLYRKLLRRKNWKICIFVDKSGLKTT